MHLRRPTRSLVAASVAVLALAAPLSSCGFAAATDRVYTPGAAPNNREGVVEVLSAAIVSAEEGSGTVIASFANTDTEDAHSLTGVSGDGLTVEEVEAIDVGPDALVNLAEEGGIPVTGEFVSGDFVELTFDFDNGERVSLDVPVVPNDSGYWEGLDIS
jgi:ABC-type nitrate/sulfonate/bicarbonate transport system substrate-binding protein